MVENIQRERTTVDSTMVRYRRRQNKGMRQRLFLWSSPHECMSFISNCIKFAKIGDKLAIEHVAEPYKTLLCLLAGDIKESQNGAGGCHPPPRHLKVSPKQAVTQLRAVTEVQAVALSVIVTMHGENSGIWN
jgi:hypothetical protein